VVFEFVETEEEVTLSPKSRQWKRWTSGVHEFLANDVNPYQSTLETENRGNWFTNFITSFIGPAQLEFMSHRSGAKQSVK